MESQSKPGVEWTGATSEPNFMEIEKYLLTSTYPDHLKNNPGRKSNFRKQASQYCIYKNNLYYKNKVNNATGIPDRSRVIKSKIERDEILSAVHEGPGYTNESKSLGGHFGRDKTYWKLLDNNVWWPHINLHVRQYIATCEQCQKGSTKFNKAAPEMHPIPVPTKVWHQVGVDLCSLPKTDEFVGICVVVDYFSKWVEAKPIKNKSAIEVANFLYELICRYGCTKIQINDQGREFCNEVSSKLHALTGTVQRITSAYHPQANGLVERMNRTIQNSMLKVLQEEQDKWPQVLQGVLFAYRTARHKSTGITPYEMMFARKPVLPINLMYEEEVDETISSDVVLNESDVTAHLATIKNIHKVVLEKANENILKAQKRQKEDYEKRHSLKKTFEIGSKVLIYNLRRADRKGGKFQLPYEGPYIVIDYIENKGLYELSNLDGRPLKVKQHGVNLKSYLERTIDLQDNQHKIDEDSNGDFDIMNISKKTYKFIPTSLKWREEKCAKLNFFPIQARQERRKKNDFIGIPHKVDPIVGDGNCLFRAVSKEITLSEEFHIELRKAAVNIMENEIYKSQFENYIGNNLDQYLEETKMKMEGTWGTNVEIVALATLLNTAIAVYYKAALSCDATWYFYCPIGTIQFEQTENACCIYLVNPGNHFNRVLSVK